MGERRNDGTDEMMTRGRGPRVLVEGARAWRARNRLSVSAAAARLGISRRQWSYMEAGVRGGRAVTVPLTVRLAMCAIERGILDYDGFETELA